MNKRDMKMDEVLAEQCYVNPSEFDYKKYAALIRADEREECAKLLETTDLGGLKDSPTTQSWIAAMLLAYADAIRARSKL